MSSLFQPLTIKSITLKNRLAVSPMCEYSSLDGFASHWHLVHLGSRAVGGAALIITEATAVSPEGRISPQDLGIWKDEHIADLKVITAFLKNNDAVPGIQLAHAGRKGSTRAPWQPHGIIPEDDGGWQTFAPSAIPFRQGESAPIAMTIADIKKVLADFRSAARRSLAAGFQWIEIHAAHGYLIHQFLSPLSNQRADAYGGSFDNRIRLLLEVVAAIQQEWPAELPLTIRISATDWTEGGWTGNDSVTLARILLTKGIDLIDCSTGGNVPHSAIPVAPLYQVPFAAQIKKETGMLTGAVGMIDTPIDAEKVIAEGSADMIFMARQQLRDPYFPLHAAQELGYDIKWPVQYERAKLKMTGKP